MAGDRCRSGDPLLITTFIAGDTITFLTRLWAMMRVGFTRETNALVTPVLVVSILLAVVVGARLQPRGQVDEEWRFRTRGRSGEAPEGPGDGE